MKTISTPQGEVILREPTAELLRAIRSFLPFGCVHYVESQKNADFGLVMKCGKVELFAVKQQPADCDEDQAYISLEANSILIAHSISTYLKNGFSGLFMPLGYIRTKEAGRFESGVAYFGYPSAHGHESQEFPYDPAYDRQFGHGFTTMMCGFIDAFKASSRGTGITMSRPIGLDVRYRLQLGALSLGFMVVGPHVVCLKTNISPERDPVWTVLRGTGISEVFHFPSITAAIDEEQLSDAKPPLGNY